MYGIIDAQQDSAQSQSHRRKKSNFFKRETLCTELNLESISRMKRRWDVSRNDHDISHASHSFSQTLLQMHDAVNELEGIDLADPDLHKAATKIQASFRGHKVRQEVNIHSTADETQK